MGYMARNARFALDALDFFAPLRLVLLSMDSLAVLNIASRSISTIDRFSRPFPPYQPTSISVTWFSIDMSGSVKTDRRSFQNDILEIDLRIKCSNLIRSSNDIV